MALCYERQRNMCKDRESERVKERKRRGKETRTVGNVCMNCERMNLKSRLTSGRKNDATRHGRKEVGALRHAAYGVAEGVAEGVAKSKEMVSKSTTRSATRGLRLAYLQVTESGLGNPPR